MSRLQPDGGDVLVGLERPRGRSWMRVVAASGRSWVLDREALEQLGFVPHGAQDYPVEISQAQCQLLDEAEQATARRRLLRLLAQRARSRQELRRLLALWPFPESCVEQALGWAADLGYVNDEELARQLLAGASMRSLGRAGWVEHLRRRGLEAELARRAVQMQLSPDWEQEHAERLARQRSKLLKGLELRQQAARLYAFLVRHGFDDEVAKTAVRRVLGDGALADDGPEGSSE